MIEHPDSTYCPQCGTPIPVCKWDGAKLVTVCHSTEPVGRSSTACDDQWAPEPRDA